MLKYKFQLNFFSGFLLIFLLLIGFRDAIPLIDRAFNLPPHFMQFNMYVWDISSPSKPELQSADFYVPALEKQFTSEDLYKIQPTLGSLIQGDRWRGYQPAIQAYFCAARTHMGIDQKHFTVISVYLKNHTSQVENLHHVNCR
jgi:hypothetical protein